MNPVPAIVPIDTPVTPPAQVTPSAQLGVMPKEEGGGLGMLMLGIGGIVSVSLAGAAAYKYGSKPADDRKRQGR
jgi:hypothetical protein